MDDFLIYSSYIILFISLILYTYSFFRKEKANVFFIIYIVFSFVIQISMEVMYHMRLNNLLLMNTFVIGQMILLGLFYKSLFKIQAQKKVVVWSMILALLIIFIQLYNDPKQIYKFNLFEITICSLLVLIFALMHFYNMLGDNKTYYYFSIGVVAFMLASTVLLLVGNLTHNLSNEFKYLSWRLNAFLVGAFYFSMIVEWKVSFSKTKNLAN
ncbi:hypothetical protein [Flavobacterium ginsenosidimutans]|uniref:hypothetical protein n=1 Tax=Flavobacterium ginsenosidimutans TaxID=687844 RepID=UPI003D9837F6